jgi:hypothetical protein
VEIVYNSRIKKDFVIKQKNAITFRLPVPQIMIVKVSPALALQEKSGIARKRVALTCLIVV